MKKLVFIPVFALFTVSTMFISCKPTPKEEAAQENVEEAKEDLAEAKQQANEEEWQNFKNEMNAVIEKNDARIAELKQNIKNTGKSADIEYQKKIDTLNERNEKLKVKMRDYKNDANSDWQSFKREFNHDMEGLGDALNNITVNNKK
ncbi:hypothetical protein [Flavobacterium sp. WC2509]|uniref:hypothetical protein n=1 Tax=Flavobacterium sp. WC2509 TaxID=3461406 RepID=UPI0040439DCD